MFRMSRFFRQNVLKAITATKWTTGYEGSLSRHMVSIDAGQNWLKQIYTIQNGQVLGWKIFDKFYNRV